MSFKGLNIRGAEFRGSDFLDPSQITSANLIFWYKWKVGITIDTGVSQWDDQSGNGYHMVQPTPNRQPAYNSSTGEITFDGSNDYLEYDAYPEDPNKPEYTFVTSKPIDGLNVVIMSRARHATTADLNALRLVRRSTGVLDKAVAVGLGSHTTSIEGLFNEGQKIISSYSTTFLAINGEEVEGYTSKSGGFYSGYPGRTNFAALVRNTSGGVPTVPQNYYAVNIFEACMHDAKLSALERPKLATYFQQKQGNF